MLQLALLAYLVFMVVRILTIPGESLPPGQEYMDLLERNHANTLEIDETLSAHRFLVIGGTGFTGSAIVNELLMRGAKGVRVMGRSFPPVLEYPYMRNGKPEFYPLSGVEYVRGTLTSEEEIRAAFKDIDVVYQVAAAYGSPNFGMLGNGAAEDKVNHLGMKRLTDIAESMGIKALIYTSSADTVFINDDKVNVNETHPFIHLGKDQVYADGELEVGDHYARTKIKGEKYLLSKNGQNGLHTMALRPNGIFGPGENSLVTKALNPAWILGAFPFYFDLDQKTDMSCIGNLAYAHVLAAHKLLTVPEKVGGKAYFITDNEIVNNAAFGVFKPVADALNIPILPWIPIPPAWLEAGGWAMEAGCHWLWENYKIEIPMMPFLTQKETYKTLRTDIHDISRAINELGYKPIFGSKQCMELAGEEFARRYGVTKN